MEKVILLFLSCAISAAVAGAVAGAAAVGLVNVSRLEMFVDELPEMPRLNGYRFHNGSFHPGNLTVGMYEKTWKFHRDLPPTPVFSFGTSREAATVPGPTIEALQGVTTHITWENHLPSRHILSWDPTIPTATVSAGVPTVVHVHGGINPPGIDGHPNAWFTSNFSFVGPAFISPTSSYPNIQDPGNVWYHDHALGLTRVNLLAGLIGAYTLRSHSLESQLRLPTGSNFDRHLFLFDRSFYTNGSLFLNSTGDNPSTHPQWQPEYFGDVIIVNGKAWPFLSVRRRRYRFRIINASNARFFRLSFSNSLHFLHLGSDSVYLSSPVSSQNFLLAPSEISDVIVDFAVSSTNSAFLLNDAPYPFPSGDLPDDFTGKVMKFIINPHNRKDRDPSRVPRRLLPAPPPPWVNLAAATRYIAMYEYESSTGNPVHLYMNGLPFESPATEKPRSGTSEVWYVINLTEDNHPLHIHLGLFVVLEQRELADVQVFKNCMMKINDARACHVEKHAKGRVDPVPAHERGWKNVFKMQPSFITQILVRFADLRSEEPYRFDVTKEPGYVYHCHILEHEDNMMMRPLKFLA